MNIIAQEARFRQRVVKYSQKHGVTEASIRYKVSRMSVYKWRAKYNGHWWSLKEHSHRPKHHPAEQTEEENDLIKRHYPYYDDMIMLWDRLREKGYKRCYQTMLRAIRRMKLDKAPCARNPHKPKPYQRADYPGQKIQIDVKFVPNYCIADGKKYYQYTAIDECTRYCYREMYDEHSTYSSKDFLMNLIKAYNRINSVFHFTYKFICTGCFQRSFYVSFVLHFRPVPECDYFTNCTAHQLVSLRNIGKKSAVTACQNFITSYFVQYSQIMKDNFYVIHLTKFVDTA